jgi:hypothetical protein
MFRSLASHEILLLSFIAPSLSLVRNVPSKPSQSCQPVKRHPDHSNLSITILIMPISHNPDHANLSIDRYCQQPCLVLTTPNYILAFAYGVVPSRSRSVPSRDRSVPSRNCSVLSRNLSVPSRSCSVPLPDRSVPPRICREQDSLFLKEPMTGTRDCRRKFKSPRSRWPRKCSLFSLVCVPCSALLVAAQLQCFAMRGALCTKYRGLAQTFVISPVTQR